MVPKDEFKYPAYHRLAKLAEEVWLSPRFVALVAAVGIVLRIVEWARFKSLWEDEAMIALNLARRDFAGLLGPLDDNQGAPVGFLFACRSCLVLFGNNEAALRLYPVIVSCLAVVLFAVWIRTGLGSRERPLAILFFSLSGAAVYFAGELKQYAGDVAWTVLVTWLGLRWWAEPTGRRALAAGLAGAAGVWFSHPLIFVLAILGTRAPARPWPPRLALVLPPAAWVGSFGANFFFLLRPLSQNDYLHDYWTRHAGWMPPPWRFADHARWWRLFLHDFFERVPMASILWPVAMAISVFGLVRLARRAPATAWVLAAPAGLALFASVLEKYPFAHRFTLFLLPAGCVFMAEGIGALFAARARWIRFAGVAVAAAFLVRPASIALEPGLLHRKPDYRTFIRMAVGRLEPDDFAYVHCSKYQLSYYGMRYGPRKFDSTRGEAFSFRGWDDRWVYIKHREHEVREWLTELRAAHPLARVWCVLPKGRPRGGAITGEAVRDVMREFGQVEKIEREDRAGLYLFEFDPAP